MYIYAYISNSAELVATQAAARPCPQFSQYGD